MTGTTYNRRDMVKDGYFYGLGFGVVAAVVFVLTHSLLLVLIPVLLAAFFLWFFRDPERVIPTGAGEIVSPGDGVVTDTELIETVDGPRMRMSIFLNVFNVHVNRVPVSGTVTRVEYIKGAFLNAMNPKSGTENEQSLIVIDAGGYEIAFKQIAGLLARRIVCNLVAGEKVVRGQRMGLIKFGSRVDVVMPVEAKLLVSKGVKVSGGSTVLAVLPLGLMGGSDVVA
ncbi:phosphatidylserine decarboxylase [Granulicella rosea]|uniref:Phosphatidylserine decarboxylase proenzyme n=1 Tax=Granulicella rosea TaxID=474952 RepID=A0A239EN07_9BACT|nr:phosphatidylserine decarboxylase family protein [Granulicella rosea]SNS46017.1 phosphatidylserine decarboxylase [Granulicella rosea]